MLKPIIVLVIILFLASCSSPVKPIEIKPGKQGGLYETSETGTVFTFYNESDTLKLDTESFIPLSDFERIQEEKSDYEGMAVLSFKLNEAGADNLKIMSERNQMKQVCFVIDGKIVAAPTMQGLIPNGLVSLNVDQETKAAIIQYLQK